MKIVCKYKDMGTVVFHVEVSRIDLEGFDGKYHTTHGSGKKIHFKSGSEGTWSWNSVKIVKIEA